MYLLIKSSRLHGCKVKDYQRKSAHENSATVTRKLVNSFCKVRFPRNIALLSSLHGCNEAIVSIG